MSDYDHDRFTAQLRKTIFSSVRESIFSIARRYFDVIPKRKQSQSHLSLKSSLRERHPN